jgi:hypothetical protein
MAIQEPHKSIPIHPTECNPVNHDGRRARTVTEAIHRFERELSVRGRLVKINTQMLFYVCG